MISHVVLRLIYQMGANQIGQEGNLNPAKILHRMKTI